MFVAVYFNHNGGFVDPSHRQRKWARRRWGRSWMSEQEGTKGRRLEGNDEGKYKPQISSNNIPAIREIASL